MKKRQLLTAVLGVGVTLVLASCASGEAETTGNGTDSTHKSPQNEVTIGIAKELTGGDIAAVTDTNTFTMLNNVQEGLYRFDQNNELQPALVEGEPEISADKLTYVFQLKQDAQWSNGDPVTAHDFEYGWKRMVNPDTAAGGAYFYDNVIQNAHAIMYEGADPDSLGIKAVDDYTLEVTLENAVPYFLDLMADPLYFPHNQNAVEEFGDSYGNSSETMVYNGPFVLTEWNGADLNWTYEKNADYWDAENVQIDEVNIEVIKEDATGANLYESGNLDWVQLKGQYAQQYAEHEDYTVIPQQNSLYLMLNQEEGQPLANKSLRQAIAFSFDRSGLTDTVLNDGSQPLDTVTPSEFSATSDGTDYVDSVTSKQAYDAEKAQQYLEQAKEETGQDTFEIEYLSDDDTSSKTIAEYIQGQIQQTLPGVTISIRTVPSNSRFAAQADGSFEMVKAGWGPDFADPVTFLDLFTSTSNYNYGHYNNPEFDQLVIDAKTVDSSNPDAHLATLAEAESLLLEEAGVVTLNSGALAVLQRPTIQDLFIDPLTGQQTYKYMTVE